MVEEKKEQRIWKEKTGMNVYIGWYQSSGMYCVETGRERMRQTN